MNNLWKLFSNVKGYYSEINSATLTGAIDVVVVRQEDGSYVGSPFHVRFGKMGVLRSREKIVDVEINGEPAPIHMKLGEAGEAFFVEESDEVPPEHLACSPIPSVDDMIKSGIEKMREEAEKEDAESSRELNSSGDLLDTTGDGEMDKLEDKPEENEGDIKAERNEKPQENNEGSKPESKDKCEENDPVHTEGENLSSEENVTEGNKKNEESEIKSDETKERSTGIDAKNEQTETNDKESFPGAGISSKVNQSDNIKDDSIKNKEGFQVELENENSSEKIETKKVEKIQETQLSSSIPEELHPPVTRKISQTASSVGSEYSLGSSVHADSETSDRKDTGDSLNLEESLELDRKPAADNREEDTVPYERLDDGTDSCTSEGIPIPGGGRPRYTDVVSDSEEYWSSRPHREFYPFSDQDTPLTTPLSQSPNKHGRESPHKYLSDTEIDIKHTKEHREEAVTKDGITWTWGQLPEGNTNQLWKEKKMLENVAKDLQEMKENKKDAKIIRVRKHHHHHHHHTSNGQKSLKVTEEGIYLDDLVSADAEVAALYIQRQSDSPGTQEDVESGLGHSLPVSPAIHESKECESTESQEIDDIAMSVCGDLRNGKVSPEKFSSHLVTYDEFNTNPVGILNNPQLVIRIDKKYYNWQVAAPLLMSYLAFQSSCKEDTMKTLKKQFMPKPDKRRGYSWFSWRAANYDDGSGSSEDELNMDMEKPRHRNVVSTKSEPDFLSSDDNLDIAETEQLLAELSGKDDDITNYRKTTRLTSDQLVMLNLKDGPNSATFSVTTKYQGTAQCSATIYLWNYDDKVVISDIDGTITKSDVLGHILPVIGGQWAQSGVATLFSSIKENGYQFLYLTARAIGQARQTREYLKSVKQDQITLPDGPVLMSPSSLITAFHREVIEKKPEEFKIQCLRDIQKVFPKNPFYAGFGNKINDVWAYRAVGIPVPRIFTINHKGEVRHELTNTFQSSYIHLRDLVDQMFPPLKLLTDDFNSFMYWRLPLPAISTELVETEEETKQQATTTAS